MDRSRQAREYIHRAQELVREGDDIYERAYSKATSYASETEYRLRQHMDYKKSVAKRLNSDIGVTLQNFDKFEIDKKTITAPVIRESNVGLLAFNTATLSDIMPHIDVPSIFNMFISDDDYYAARRQRDEARRYKEQMKMEREKLNNYREKMSEIRSFIDSERNEIDSLMGKLKNMTDQLNSSMKKSSFSEQESIYLKAIHKIAQNIANLLSTDFLNDKFSINQRYQNIFEGIKTINQTLPSTPSITDVNFVKRILDIPVTVY